MKRILFFLVLLFSVINIVSAEKYDTLFYKNGKIQCVNRIIKCRNGKVYVDVDGNYEGLSIAIDSSELKGYSTTWDEVTNKRYSKEMTTEESLHNIQKSLKAYKKQLATSFVFSGIAVTSSLLYLTGGDASHNALGYVSIASYLVGGLLYIDSIKWLERASLNVLPTGFTLRVTF